MGTGSQTEREQRQKWAVGQRGKTLKTLGRGPGTRKYKEEKAYLEYRAEREEFRNRDTEPDRENWGVRIVKG